LINTIRKKVDANSVANSVTRMHVDSPKNANLMKSREVD